MSDTKPIGFWFKVLDRLNDQKFFAAIEEHGITLRQFQLMTVLGSGEKSLPELEERIDALSAALGPTSPTESTLDNLSELIESGWVSATADGYESTERGQAAFGGLMHVLAENEMHAKSGIDEAQMRSAIETMQLIARNLGYNGAI